MYAKTMLKISKSRTGIKGKKVYKQVRDKRTIETNKRWHSSGIREESICNPYSD